MTTEFSPWYRRLDVRGFIITTVAACAALTTPPTLAAKPAILVLELEGAGLPNAVASTLDAAIRDEVRSVVGGRTNVLPKPALDFAGMKLAAGCVEDGVGCLVVIGRTLGAARILQTKISGRSNAGRLDLTLIEVGRGRATKRSFDLTDIAADSAVELRLYVAAVFGVKKKPPPGEIGLFVASEIGKLDGAEVLLDDKKVPRSLLASVAVGQHRVEVRQQGFETFIWVGTVRPGRRTKVGVTFIPTKSEPPVATPPLVTTPPITTPPIARLEPRPTPAPPPPVDATPPDTTPAPTPVQPKKGGRVVTWLLGGAALVAGGVGGFYGVKVLGDRKTLDDMQAELTDACLDDPSCGRKDVCDFDGKPQACIDGGRHAAISTVAWISAGALAAGSVVAFFVEGSSGDDVEVSGAIVPTGEGAAASMLVRF